MWMPSRLPDGLAVPEQEGTYVTTFATANIRQGIETHPWDLVVMDEADAARRWYSSQQGAMAKKLGEHAGKVLYMSATPFHTALELGHMTKLGLWDNEGFDIWGKQFGIYRDKEGNYGGGNAPRSWFGTAPAVDRARPVRATRPKHGRLLPSLPAGAAEGRRGAGLAEH